MNRKNTFFVSFAVIFLLFIVVGLFLDPFIIAQAKSKMDKELEHVAVVSLAAINPERVKRLAAFDTDYDFYSNSDYNRVKEQLVKIGESFKPYSIDSIYLMSVNENGIFFIVDSMLPEEARYSAPGVFYNEPDQSLLDTISKNITTVSDVYTDEYGTFISRFSPVLDFTTGQTVAYLGVDFDYSFLKKAVLSSRSTVYLSMLFIYLLILSFALYLHKRFESQREAEASENKIKTITDSTLDSIVMVDKEGKIVFWNKSAETLFKCPSAKALGNSFSILTKNFIVYLAKDRQLIKDFSFSPNFPFLGELLEIEIKAKFSIYIEANIINTEIKGQTFSIGVFRDVSIKRKREFEIIKQKEDMEKLNQLMVGRETKMIELKSEIASLKDNKK